MAVHLGQRDWSAGSYLPFYLATIPMHIALAVTLFFVANNGYDEAHFLDIRFLMGVQVTFGFLFLMQAGIAFDVLPLIHNLPRFSAGQMSTYILLSCAGQVSIAVGAIYGETPGDGGFFTVGVALICASLSTLISPAINVIRGRNRSDVNGVSAVIPAITTQFVAILVLITWLVADSDTNLRSIMSFLMLEAMWWVLLFTIFASHFNRRMGLNILTERRGLAILGVSLTCMIIGIGRILLPVTEGTWIILILDLTIHLLPLIVLFFGIRPRQILEAITVGRVPVSKPILTSYVMCLAIPLAIATIAIIEAVRSGPGAAFPQHGPLEVILLIGIMYPALNGTGFWLHHDHLRTPEAARPGRWAFAIGTMLVCFAVLFFSGIPPQEFQLINRTEVGPIQRVVFLLCATLLLGGPMVQWMRSLLGLEGTWHRIPMFWDRYLDEDEGGSTTDEPANPRTHTR